ncbi:helix-turn-helix domain-containing protein [Chitinophaga rhizophila]|uniref:Helix-turn-helix domain-containing protein n=1 Tax=Chitinophaga rhizophila TaxID=2866212 RepID=A0ABS7GI71_9BACT|nr:helix-turn-helix domain-containing protein [Chitinophaga rhizophila]MBW8687394.1 helix-turn-helix domain-containing protein [Chitinophaga rhizophila]
MQDTLLIVDDDQHMLQLLAEELGNDYLIFTAEDGQRALEITANYPVRIIIAAAITPVVNGFELCLQLKKSPHYAHIPIILLTGNKAMQHRLEGLKAGADACIERPFPQELLKVQIASLLDNRKKIRAYYTQHPLAHMSVATTKYTSEDFLASLNSLILENIENTALDIDLLAKKLNISRPTLYRKVKALSDLTPNELVSVVRLKKAAELLTSTGYKIFEVAMMTGFNSQSSFGKAFLKQFRMTPTAFQQMRKSTEITGSPLL